MMTTTQRDVTFQPERGGRIPDSPPARVSARRARETNRPTTPRKAPTVRVGAIGASLRRAGGRWWVWTSQPASLATTWRESAVAKARVPLGSGPLVLVWRISNWTDRLLMFGLILAAPTFLTGPLRWLAARPTRRFAFYTLGGIVAVLVLTGR